MKSFQFICFSIISVILVFGCTEKQEETWTPEPTILPSDSIILVKDTIYSANDKFLMQYAVPGNGDMQLHYTSDYLPTGNYVKIINHGDNNCDVIFYAEDFDMGILTGNSENEFVPRPSFWGISRTVTIPISFTPSSYTYTNIEGTEHGRGTKFTGAEKISLNGVSLDITMEIYPTYVNCSYSINKTAYFYKHNSSEYYRDCTYALIDSQERNNNLKYISSPFILNWNSTSYPDELRETISPVDFLQLILNTNFFDATPYGFETSNLISIGTLLSRISSIIKLEGNNNGDPLTRIQLLIGTIPQFPLNMSVEDYLPINSFKENPFYISGMTPTTFLLNVDPKALSSISVPKEIKFIEYENELLRIPSYYTSATPDMYRLLSNLMLTLSPENADGILMNYYFDDNSFSFSFAEEELSLQFLKTLILHFISEPYLKQNLIKQWENDPSLKPYLSDLTELLENIDVLFENTSNVSFGFSYSVITPSNDIYREKYNLLYGE